jgi:hypothetical protein
MTIGGIDRFTGVRPIKIRGYFAGFRREFLAGYPIRCGNSRINVVLTVVNGWRHNITHGRAVGCSARSAFHRDLELYNNLHPTKNVSFILIARKVHLAAIDVT